MEQSNIDPFEIPHNWELGDPDPNNRVVKLIDETSEKNKPHQLSIQFKDYIADPDTGAIKADANKNRLDLLPLRAIEQVGRVMTYGASKYTANNWRRGFNWTRTAGAAMRHLFAWMRNEDLDPETGISHIAHAATNLLFLLEMISTNTGKDDRYKY